MIIIKKLSQKMKILILSTLLIYFITIHFNNRISFQKASSIDDSDLLQFFYEKNVFLTDYDKLKDISVFKNSTIHLLDFQKFLHSDYIQSFGVFQNDVENLLQINENLCETEKLNGQYKNETRVTLIMFKCNGKKIGVNIFYNRDEFLWIGASSWENNSLKWFNDVPRAMQR
jgi:hypothetical protein